MARQPRSLQGLVVAVTGGGRGIGRATAGALQSAGARVAIGDVDRAAADEAATEIGGGAVALDLDVTDPESFVRFLDAVEEALGPLDVLVNNAGIAHVGPFLEQDEASARRMVDINLHGVITGSRLAMPRLLRSERGHLVNIASSAGKLTPAGIATYTATKHGVVGFTEALRAEHRGAGVEFSIVMPGVVNTEMVLGYDKSPAADVIEPSAVAEAIVEALRRPRVDVFVPRRIGPLHRFTNVLPRPVREAITRALKVDQVTWNADPAARRGYEDRAARSEPGLEPGAARGSSAGAAPRARA